MHGKKICNHLFSVHSFPQRHSFQKGAYTRVSLGIGGNQPMSLCVFWHLLQFLRRHRRIHLVSTSPVYYNPPFGFVHQNWFYNATLTLQTRMSVRAFFALTSYLERRFGRPRHRDFKNAPRIIDIDIIFFGPLSIHHSSVNIPHSEWSKRDSVLVPLLFETA